MGLQVWLPLNKDLRQQGLSDIKATNYGATLADKGKIGKCYLFNGTGVKITIPTLFTSQTKEFSISLWVYISEFSESNYSCIISNRTDINGKGLNIWVNSNFIRIDDGGGSPIYWQINYNFQLNTWTHLCITWSAVQGAIGKCLYINGVLKNSNSTVGTLDGMRNDFITIGNDTVSVDRYRLKGKINDFRIYDHVLSAKEVKLLSQGLVAHYCLNNPQSTNNLIPNGFGFDGIAGWNNGGNSSTSQIPSSIDPTIKRSFLGYVNTKDYISIDQNCTYNYSCYLKKVEGTSVTSCYPSIIPYDIDKKRIDYYNQKDGFNNSFKTTLAQPLHNGDTVIYATDLSNWTVGDNYFYHVAIFSYRDTNNFVYPDMEYTADSPAFGTRTDKSHIDKTNNTIILNAPFSGEDRPAGTTICQASEGSTYYYPMGSVSVSTLTDWTYKERKFTPINVNFLKWAKYIQILTNVNSGAWVAGMRLIEINPNNNLVKDLSAGGKNTQRINNGLGIRTLGKNTDTYFTINLSEDIVPENWYEISLDLEGLQNNQYWCFPLGWQNNANLRWYLTNGKNKMIFCANEGNWGSKRLFMDDSDGTDRTKIITISNVEVKRALKDRIIHDVTGNGYDGIISGDTEITYTSPKYKNAIHFNEKIQYILIDNLMTLGFQDSYSFAWYGCISSYSSTMTWGFMDGIRLNGIYNGTTWNTGDGSENPLYQPGTTTQVSTPTVSEWHHWVMVGNGEECKVYQDGVLWGVAKTYKSISGTKICLNGWGVFPTYHSNDLSISDFRIYSTALTAEEVKQLYDTVTSIDNKNNVYGYQLMEVE